MFDAKNNVAVALLILQITQELFFFDFIDRKPLFACHCDSFEFIRLDDICLIDDERRCVHNFTSSG